VLPRRVHRIVRVFALGALLAPSAAALVMSGCSSDSLKAPQSDTQFDDPDDPGTGSVGGAADASTQDAHFDASRSDGGRDAGDAGDAHD